MKTKDIIKKYNIRLTKSLGQNFLTDESVVSRIACEAGIGNNDLVIEVGPGIGILTRELAQRAGRVVAVEIDAHLVPALKENIKEFANVEIVNKDILKVDVKQEVLDVAGDSQARFIPSSVKVVANLPYYITTPIIMKFLEEDLVADSMVFMLQKEVADRMVAKPGGKDYGALSVAVQYYSLPERLFDVPPHCFIPQPDVESTVIRLNIYKTKPVELLDKNLFFKVVRASFGQRRKTLVNALFNSGYFIETKEEIREILKNIDIDEMQRGETLSIGQFAQLSNLLFKKNC